MPTASMQKIMGVGCDSERKKLMNLLTKFGCVELTQCAEIQNTEHVSYDNVIDEANLKLARIKFAGEFINSQKNIAKKILGKKELSKVVEKLPMVEQKPEIEYEKFVKLRENEGEIFEKIAQLEAYNEEIVELKAQELKSNLLLEQLKPFINLNIKFSDIVDTKHVNIMLGTIPKLKLKNIPALEDSFPNLIIENLGGNNQITLAIICLKSEKDSIMEKLVDIEFSQANLNYHSLPSEMAEVEQIKLKEIKFTRNDIASKVVENFCDKEFIRNRRLLEDFYNIELQKAYAERDMRVTKSAFIFEGWVPTKVAKLVAEQLDKSDITLAYAMRDVEEGDNPPTLSDNNSLVASYQNVTNMFSVPSYSEINPNPFVSFFFILFFGVMISDAGYGLLMTLGAGIILAIAKPRKHEMSMVKIIFMGGISTIFWGILFGGYFGIENFIIPPLMFNPLDEPIYMLVLSLGLGLFQMLFGMGINAYALFKQKRPLDAIFGVFSWYALILGIAMFALAGANNIVKYIGIALLASGLIGMMVAGSLHKKGAKKIGGAFSNLYGIINFFSDLLSYTRLFGLGLATGVIALVFNKIAMVIVDINIVIGIVMAPILLIGGHLFNIAINTLGAYVHNSRLQFVEFFGKFYEGGGELFKPLGRDMKYYNFKLGECVSDTLHDSIKLEKLNKKSKSAKAQAKAE